MVWSRLGESPLTPLQHDYTKAMQRSGGLLLKLLNDALDLARIEAGRLELEPAPRSPVFVLFPTLSTHLPFRPVPSYQPDWQRMLGDSPYDAADLKRSFAQTPAWLDMGESYVAALQYALTSLEGFLLQRDDAGLVIVLLGDHQHRQRIPRCRVLQVGNECRCS